MPGAAHDGDKLDHLVGETGVVRDAFEQMPLMLVAMAGPEHRIVAMNAAFRVFVGRSALIGMPIRESFPEIAGQQIYELLDRVYSTGQAETGRGWRAQVDIGGLQDLYADFTVVPRRAADGTVNGLLVTATDAAGRIADQQAAEQQAADAERRCQAEVGVVAELQEALLPAALPVLPQARIAARYLVAGQGRSAGGDWFDAIVLPDGRVALVVGDVVGHGVAASAAMGQLRAVLSELLTAEPELAEVLRRADSFATQTPGLRAATLAVAVLDPADGTLRYTTCGHPPPLIIGVGGAARFLDSTGSGPLGTGSPPALASATLEPGEVVLLYSNGLIERPNRTVEEGMAELARVAADAATGRAMPGDAAPTPSERVCQLTVELLTRTGYADDVTALAAQRLPETVPALRLRLPGVAASITTVRTALSDWLDGIDVVLEDREGLLLAVVEVVTNVVEHAYPSGSPGSAELEATLGEDGYAEFRITDHGAWRIPDPGDYGRGQGLMVAEHVVDNLLISHPPQEASAPLGSRGTVVTLRHRLHRGTVLASDVSAQAAAHAADPPFATNAGAQNGVPRVAVRGPVDILTADDLVRELLSASRGGTLSLIVDLVDVTQLASAGVRALYQVREQLTAHQQDLTLVAAPGSSAGTVLDLVQLPRAAG